jgi:hypothetical protein
MGVGLAIIGNALTNLAGVALAGNLLFIFMRPIFAGSIFAML